MFVIVDTSDVAPNVFSKDTGQLFFSVVVRYLIAGAQYLLVL